MMNQNLINDLTNDLKPCCPACPYSMTLKIIAMAAFGGAALLFTLGLRPDAQAALSHVLPWWKSGMFMMLAVGAALTLARLGIPGRGAGVGGPALMLLGLAGLFSFVVAAFAFTPDVGAVLGGFYLGGKFTCLGSVTGLGLLLMAGGVFLMRRMAYTRPGVAGALLGIAAGSFAAAAYAWTCINDQPLYVAAWYTLPIIVLGMVGGLFGKRFFRL
jgi:hypothetical protein